MSEVYQFLIQQDSTGAIVVVKISNGEVFYEARNRSKYEAVRECLIYMSTFPNTQVLIEQQLNDFYHKKR